MPDDKIDMFIRRFGAKDYEDFINIICEDLNIIFGKFPVINSIRGGHDQHIWNVKLAKLSQQQTPTAIKRKASTF